MRQDVKLFVHNDLVCQQNKYQTLSLASILQCLPISKWIMEDISLDFIDGLPNSGGYDFGGGLTVSANIATLSLYSSIHGQSAPVIFCRAINKLHGVPCSTLSNQDALS